MMMKTGLQVCLKKYNKMGNYYLFCLPDAFRPRRGPLQGLWIQKTVKIQRILPLSWNTSVLQQVEFTTDFQTQRRSIVSRAHCDVMITLWCNHGLPMVAHNNFWVVMFLLTMCLGLPWSSHDQVIMWYDLVMDGYNLTSGSTCPEYNPGYFRGVLGYVGGGVP